MLFRWTNFVSLAVSKINFVSKNSFIIPIILSLGSIVPFVLESFIILAVLVNCYIIETLFLFLHPSLGFTDNQLFISLA